MDILELVPHDPPMVLLDSLSHVDEEGLKACVTIRPDIPFYEARGVPSYVGIEYIAQAISAFSGYQSKQRGRPVQIGFLLGTRKLELERPWFTPGQLLDVEAKPVYNDGQMAVFDGTVTCAGDVIVRARVNVYQPDQPEKLIEEAKRDV